MAKNMVLIYYRVLYMALTYFWMLEDEGMAGVGGWWQRRNVKLKLCLQWQR